MVVTIVKVSEGVYFSLNAFLPRVVDNQLNFEDIPLNRDE